MSDRDELLALIVQWADESARRSGSPYVDERQGWIRDTAVQIGALPADYYERRSGRERRSANALDGGNMGRRVSVRRGTGGAIGGAVYQDIASIAIGNAPSTFLAGGGSTHALQAVITWTDRGLPRVPRSIVWSSDDATNLAVDAATGLLTTGSPVSDETVTITLTIEGHTTTADIVVSPLPATGVSSVTIIPPVGQQSPFNLSSGQTMDFDVEVRNEYGEIDPAETVTWASNATGVATVNSSTGVVTYVANGTAIITATSVTDGTKSDSVTVNGVSAAASTVEITPGTNFSAANGSTINFSAVVKDANGNVLSGRTITWASNASGTVSINSSSGVATVAGTSGSATITATDTISSLTDTVVVTATAAAGAGELESPTGGRPQYGPWTLAWQYNNRALYDLWDADPDPANSTDQVVRMIQEWYETASQPTLGYGDWPSSATWFWQMTGDPAWRDLAWSKWYQWTLTTSRLPTGDVKGDTYRERFVSTVIQLDWLYPGLTVSQKTQAWAALGDWVLSVLGTHPAQGQYTGGLGLADSDQITGAYPGMVAIHYFDAPENPWYLNLLDRVIPKDGNRVLGSPFDTPQLSLSHSGRSAWYTIVSEGARGGWWFEGEQYNDGTCFLALQVLALRSSGNNGSTRGAATNLAGILPEIDQWITDTAEVLPYVVTNDLRYASEFGDDQGPNEIVAAGYWMLAQALAGVLPAGTAQQRLQRLAADLWATHQSAIRSNSRAVTRVVWFWQPTRSALVGSLYTTYSAKLIGKDTDPQVGGIGHLQIKGPNNLHVALWASNIHRRTDHPWRIWNNYQVYWNPANLVPNGSTIPKGAGWIVDNPTGYTPPHTVYQRAMNGLLLAGLGPMRENANKTPQTPGWGLVRQMSGTAGGLPWFGVESETLGRYKLPGDTYKVEQFVNRAAVRLIFLPEVAAGYHAIVIADNVDAVHPMADGMVGNPNLGRSGAHNVATSASASYFDDVTFPLPSLPSGTLFTPPAGITIPAGKWAVVRFSAAKGGGTSPTATWSTTKNYDTEALALANLPALPGGHFGVGYATVQAPAGVDWISGTNALRSGGGTNPANATNYYPDRLGWINFDNLNAVTLPFAADSDKEQIYRQYLRQSRLVVGERLFWTFPGVTPDISVAGLTTWTDPQTSHVHRIHHLAPTASTSPAAAITRQVLDPSALPVSNSDATGRKVVVVSCDSVAQVMKFRHVHVFGSGGTPPSVSLQSNNPDVVNVGSRQVTFNSTSETVS